MRYALDTNVLIALGKGEPNAIQIIRLLQASGAQIYVPTRTFDEALHQKELGRLDIDPSGTVVKYGLAVPAISRAHKLFIENTAAKLLQDGTLPKKERHDAEIFTESAPYRCGVLFTNDAALLKIDRGIATKILAEFNLKFPVPKPLPPASMSKTPPL